MEIVYLPNQYFFDKNMLKLVTLNSIIKSIKLNNAYLLLKHRLSEFIVAMFNVKIFRS